MVFLVLKTARYVDPEEVVEFGEILIFLGDGFIITVRHGEASELHGRARRASRRTPSCSRRGPGAVLHAIVDKVVDDYSPALDGLERTSRRSRTEVFSGERAEPGRAHLQAQARGARVQPRGRRRWSSRSTAWPRAATR